MKRFLSRKFLASLGGVLIAIGTVLSGDVTPEKLGMAALAIGSLVAYIFSEGHVDAAAARATGEAAAAAASATAPATSHEASTAATDTAAGMGGGTP